MVESWLKDSGPLMDEALVGSDYSWFGKDRPRRNQGGVGFVVHNSFNAKVPKGSTYEGLFWIEVTNNGRWFIAVVYIPPDDSGGKVDLLLDELVADIIEFGRKGKVMVVGDFNARMGELNNVIAGVNITEEDRTYPRTSSDLVVNSRGRKILFRMNSAGMILLNGLSAKAEPTSWQQPGNSVIDLMWIQEGMRGELAEFKTCYSKEVVLDDHSLVVSTFFSTSTLPDTGLGKGRGKAQDGRVDTLKTAPPERVRIEWSRHGSYDHPSWIAFRAAADDLLAKWCDDVVSGQARVVDGATRVNRLWVSWMECVSKMADAELGRAVRKEESKPKFAGQPYRDKLLTRLIEECAASRHARNRSTGEQRQTAHAVYNQHRARVKQRLRQLHRRWLYRTNTRLLKLRVTDSKRYWNILKTLTGRDKKPQKVPAEALVGDQVVKGEGIYRVWREACEIGHPRR